MAPVVASATPPRIARPPIITAAEKLRFSGFVVDAAGLLSSARRQAITRRLDRFQQETGYQMAVVTVASLHGEDITTFTTRLANRWGVGRKEFNDGIVLLVAPAERKARIAVGLGLEHNLPDAVCTRIMQHDMIPAFARGDMAGGIEAGVTSIIAFLSRQSGVAGGRR